MPRLMLIELIYHVVLWLNAIPEKSGVSETLSPCKIVYQHKLDFAKHCRLPFGMYCEVHDEPMSTNTMVTRTTRAIVLSLTGNMQGTYKFFSLATGKKVKQCAFTPYPMLDLVIRKVKVYGKSTTLPGSFDLANRNGILFEWNEEVDKFSKGIIEVKDVVLYHSLAAGHPGVALVQDQPLLSIEEELIPQGQAEDAAARNANLEPFDIAGVAAASLILHANTDELDDYKIDNDNGIIAVGDIPQQPPHAPLIVNDTDKNNVTGNDDNNNNAESNNNNRSNNNNNNNLCGKYNDVEPSHLAAATNADDNKSGSNQGVQRLQRRGKGVTKKYAEYSLFMAAKQAKKGGACWALICCGCVFFSAENLSDAKPIPKEDREEFALRVTLAHYSMNGDIKKFKAKGKAGVTKELTQMHNMSAFHPIEVEALT